MAAGAPQGRAASSIDLGDHPVTPQILLQVCPVVSGATGSTHRQPLRAEQEGVGLYGRLHWRLLAPVRLGFLGAGRRRRGMGFFGPAARLILSPWCFLTARWMTFVKRCR